jgi:MFS family permease
MNRSALWALYAGGFLGPFGGAVLAVLVPELRAAFHVSTSDVALAVPAYLIPFAALQLVSGTLGERLGRRRTVRVAYVGYAVASALAGLAPSLDLFLAARALQGVANAFTTPLLLAGVADLVDRERLGRTIGTFAGIQAGGVSFAPLLGGIAAIVDWRLVFIGPALVAVVLAFYPPPDGVTTDAARPRFRALLTARVGLLSAAAFLGYLGLTGLPFLVSIRIDDAFAIAPGWRGVVLATYGAAGLVLGRAAGVIADRHGARRTAIGGAIGGALAVSVLGVLPSALAVALVWTLAGVASAFLWAGLNTLAVETSASNRAGVVSVYQAFKFAGTAVAPVLWLPLYGASAGGVFAAAAAVALLVVGTLLPGSASAS